MNFCNCFLQIFGESKLKLVLKHWHTMSSWKWMCLIWSLFSYFTWGELIILEWIQIVHYKYLGIHVIKYFANYTSSNLPFTSSSRHTHHQVAKFLTLENYNFITHYQYVSFLSSLFLCKCSLWLNQPRPKVICVWNIWLFLEVKNFCKIFGIIWTLFFC